MYAALASFFNQSFFQGMLGSALANVLAVVLGIPAGLYLERWISSRGAKQQREHLRAALKRATEQNLGMLHQVRDQLAKSAVPTFGLDLTLFDATAHTKYTVVDDIPLCASIDHLRFELAHMDRQLDALLRLELDASARAAGNFAEVAKRRCTSWCIRSL